MNKPPCSDCGCQVTNMGPATIARGASVREPGEALCASCTASRLKMVREVDTIPADLAEIKVRTRWAKVG